MILTKGSRQEPLKFWRFTSILLVFWILSAFLPLLSVPNESHRWCWAQTHLICHVDTWTFYWGHVLPFWWHNFDLKLPKKASIGNLNLAVPLF